MYAADKQEVLRNGRSGGVVYRGIVPLTLHGLCFGDYI